MRSGRRTVGDRSMNSSNRRREPALQLAILESLERRQLLSTVQAPSVYAESENKVNISWGILDDSQSRSAIVERSVDGVHFQAVSLDGSTIQSPSGDAPDTSVEPSMSYFYRVVYSPDATPGGAGDLISDVAIADTPGQGRWEAPSIWTSGADHCIHVQWRAVASSYRLEVSVDFGFRFTDVGGEVDADMSNWHAKWRAETSAVDIGWPDQEFDYRVVTNLGEISDISDIATPSEDPASLLPAPVISNTSPTELTLSWSPVPGASSYVVQRRDNGLAYRDVWADGTNSWSDRTSLVDAGLSPGATYDYRILTNRGQTSVRTSAVASVTLAGGGDWPAPWEYNFSGVKNEITWIDMSSPYYRVQRSTNGTDFADLWINNTNIVTGVTSLIDSSVWPGQAYYYRVITAGGSVSTMVAAGGYGTEACAPPRLSATSPYKVRINWNGHASSYKLQRSGDGVNFADVWIGNSNIFTNRTSLIDATVCPGRTYYYRIGTNERLLSPVVQITTPPPDTSAPAPAFVAGHAFIIHESVWADSIVIKSAGTQLIAIVNNTMYRCRLQDAELVVIYGGAGNDRVDARLSPVPCFVRGEKGNDTIIGSAFNDTLIGGAGNDLIAGGGGSDILAGQNGNETLKGGIGNDSLVGGPGNDGLFGQVGKDLLVGNDGNDFMSGGSGGDTLSENNPSFADIWIAGRGVYLGQIDTGALIFERAHAPSFVPAADGSDTLSGGTGNDTVTYAYRKRGLAISLDGTPNDGAPGERDNVLMDVENIIGGLGSDLIVADDSNNILSGGLPDNSGDVGNQAADSPKQHSDTGDDTIYGMGGERHSKRRRRCQYALRWRWQRCA